MTRHRLGWTLSVTLLLLALALALGSQPGARAQAHPDQLVLIVGPTSPLQDVSVALLRRIFLGEATVYQGTRLIPLNYSPKDPLRLTFDDLVLGFTADAAGRYWVDRRIRGQGLPPRVIPNAALVRAVVAKLPGAIGYVTVSQLGPDVRAVQIAGRSYTDPEYLLAED